jgi:probable O-glycosylation ligase (exosortase A-associated)
MLRTLFVFGIILPGVMAALYSRMAGLCLYIWFALFRPEEWMWIDIRPYRPSLILGLLVLLPSLIQGIIPNLTHPISMLSVLFLGTALVAQENAINQAVGWYWVDFLARLLMICLLAVSIVNTRERFLYLATVIAFSFGFHSGKGGLFSLIHGGVRFADGLSGAFIDNNGYALGASMILPFLMLTAQNVKHKWIRVGFYAAVPLSMFTVVSTFSRGGLLAMAGAILTYILLQKRRGTVLVMAVAIAFAVIPFVPMPKGYTERMETIQTYDEVEEGSALQRLYFWQVAIAMANAHPTGIGLRNFDATYDRYDVSNGAYGRGRSVHSSHFQVLAEQGYFGALLWVALFGYAFLTCVRVRSRSKDPALSEDDRRFLFTAANALMVSMVAFLIGGSFIALALNDLTWLTFALTAILDRVSKTLPRTSAEPVTFVRQQAPPAMVSPHWKAPAASTAVR